MTPTPAEASNSERLIVKLGLVGLKTLHTVDIGFPDRRRKFFIDKTCINGKHNQDHIPGSRRGAGRSQSLFLLAISVVGAVVSR